MGDIEARLKRVAELLVRPRPDDPAYCLALRRDMVNAVVAIERQYGKADVKDRASPTKQERRDYVQ